MALTKILRNQRGQVLVEMALILPIICLLLLGMMEFGRIFHTYLVLTNASREGARAAAVGQTDHQVVAAVVDTAASLHTEVLTITIDPGEGGRARGQGVTVQVAHKLPLTAPLFSTFLPNPFPVEAATTMRME